MTAGVFLTLIRFCGVLVSLGFASAFAMPVGAQISRPEGSPLAQGGDGTGQSTLQMIPESESGPKVATAPGGAMLRWLDKMSGQAHDIRLAPGDSAAAGGLVVTLKECRYPIEDPTSDAYAFLTIREAEGNASLFSGWMIADSPALSALDHPRYDVWPVRCVTTSEGVGTRP